jgi:hypothetical protein
MRQLIAAPIRMIVGATLPSARVGEGLETTQPRHFASVIAKGSLGASIAMWGHGAQRRLGAESRHSQLVTAERSDFGGREPPAFSLHCDHRRRSRSSNTSRVT